MFKSKNRINILLSFGIALLMAVISISVVLISGNQPQKANAEFKENDRMKQLILPNEQEFEYKDFKQTTIDYLTYMFDDSNVYNADNGDHGGYYLDNPRSRKIGRYTTSGAGNIDAYFDETGNTTWGIPSYIGWGVGDGEMGEGINVLAAIMSGGLAGMNLTDYNAGEGREHYNFVKAAVAYYQSQNGENVVLNSGTGTKTGGSFWYELLPGVLFCVMTAQFPSESSYTYDIVTNMAKQWNKAVIGMGGAAADFGKYFGYSLSLDQPVVGNWREPDAAAGIAYILYSAYSFNSQLKEQGINAPNRATDQEIESFRQGAIWCMNYLDKLNVSPFYEVLTFLAPYLAARMNVEQGTNYNASKMVSWTLDGSSDVRGGWGMVTDNWGGVYTSGLMGSLTDGDGYAFAMNTFDAMLGFAPMVKYDSRFAKDIAKWVLCASQSAKAYFPEMYPNDGTVNTYYGKEVWNGDYQSGKWIPRNDPRASFIAYEGLRKYQRRVEYDANGTRFRASNNTAISPYASGDAYTFNWNGHTDYGLYGSSHMGLFGGTIKQVENKDDVPMILETDLDVLDIFNNTQDIRFRLYFNPYQTQKDVVISVTSQTNYLYNTITKEILSSQNAGENKKEFSMKAGETVLIAEIPAGRTVVKNGTRYTLDTADGIFIAEDRGDLTMVVTDSENNTISANQNVSGTLKVSLSATIPEGAVVESLTLEAGDKVFYQSATIEGTAIQKEIDTTELRNGVAPITAQLRLSGGLIETATLTVRVLNINKTPAISYESDEDMAAKWRDATADIKENWTGIGTTAADHCAQIVAESGGGIKISIPENNTFAFSSSEEFYLDFSRGAMLDVEIGAVTSKFALKLWVEGNQNLTGEYLIREDSVNGDKAGVHSFDLVETIQKEDPSFNPIGAKRVMLKVAPVGNAGDSVTIKSIDAYHIFASPNLDEPSDYTWGFEFPSVWLSLWNPESAREYNNQGKIVISGDTESKAIESPYIIAELAQNPVIEIAPFLLEGEYFAGIKIEGSDTLYILEENISSIQAISLEIAKIMRSKYPEVTIPATTGYKIVVGAEAGSTLTLGEINTLYKLPDWGMSVSGDAWLDFSRKPMTSAEPELTFDASNRAVIKNTANASSTTIIAALSGKFTINFDYNPEIDVIVRGISAQGQYRLSLRMINSSTDYIIKDWSRDVSTQAFSVNLNEKFNNALRGSKSIYLSIEVLGGQNSVTVQRIDTRYKAVMPVFGNTYTKEIASWQTFGQNPSVVAVESDGKVTISQNAYGSKGVVTPIVAVASGYYPILNINLSELSGEAYVIMRSGGNEYLLSGEDGIKQLGNASFDVRALCDIPINSAFNATFEFGGTGAGFLVRLASISFMYRLNSASGYVFNESANTLAWSAVEGAEGYSYEVLNAESEAIKSGNVSLPLLELNSLALETGIYSVRILAMATGYLDSLPSLRAIKQGDIQSVVLGAVQGLTLNGLTLSWDAQNGAIAYGYSITDKDTSSVIASGETETNSLNISQYLTAFNFSVSITALGDGVVYLDGTASSYDFFTDPVARFTAKAFVTMASENNGSFAELDQSAEYAVIKVPNNGNWGSIASLAFDVDFSKNPVLKIEFGEGSIGGWWMRIKIDGQAFYLMDNTFTFGTYYLDINAILASRTDGPQTAYTGIHSTSIVFGATMGDNSGTPSVYIKEANFYQLTEGSGTPMLGELEKPVLTVNTASKTVSWTAVENAQKYIVVISNEYGTLINTEVTTLSYDFSVLKIAGDYSVSITAVGSGYYNSETAVQGFTLSGESDEGDTKDKGCGSMLVMDGASCLILLLVMVFVITLVKSRKKKSG